jgi:predicted deacylase
MPRSPLFAVLLLAGAAGAQDFPVAAPTPPATPVAPAPVPAPVAEAVPTPAPSPKPTASAQPVPAESPFFGPPEMEFVGPPEATEQEGVAAGTAEASPGGVAQPISLLGQEILPGERRELRWKVGESFDGTSVTTPVVVVHGTRTGARLCLTAAIHGDEINGIEVVRRVLNSIDANELSGTVVGVPIVNLLGFSRGSRYLPDRRDLNRFFPGTSYGSAASRIAHSLFRKVAVHCDALVDFHTGSFDRANLPQVRGDLTLPSVLEFTRGFGAAPVLHSPGARGMLRLAATDRGIPAVTFEVGAPTRLEPESIEFAVQSITTLMHKMGMTRSFRMWAEPQATFYESKWVRVDSGGMLFSEVRLGDRVRMGQRLGKVIDPVQNAEHEVSSPFRGRVIGMALNQVVLPGFAAFHVGIETSEQEAVEEASQPAEPGAIEQMEGDQIEASRRSEAETGPGEAAEGSAPAPAEEGEEPPPTAEPAGSDPEGDRAP